MVEVAKAFPTGETATSVVLLKKAAPGEVVVGQSYDYTYTVTNLTKLDLGDVVVTDAIGDNFNAAASTPQAEIGAGKAIWKVGTLGPNETKVLKLSGTAKGSGDIANCAEVTYRTNLCLNIKAVQPGLKLTKQMPAEALLCDVIPITLVVTNTGTGVARNVKVTDTLPAGMKTLDGQQTVTFNACDLAAGQSREYKISAKADKTGQFNNPATAVADAGLKADAAASITVRQPVLDISKAVTRAEVFPGRPIDYDITVANKGDAPADGLVVVDTLPAGTSFVKASDNGSAGAGAVTWNLGTLAPGASKKVSVTVRADAISSSVINKVTARANCANPVSAEVAAVVKGIPAILLEVIDVSDPIEVGGQETYVITATNQGSAVDTNVKIVCELEEHSDYVSSSGATVGTAAGKVITFAPLPSLAPKAKATWNVVVKAVKAGDTRFKTTLTSDVLERPVQETESTHMY